ncbi:MAG TPA: protease inhibitor I42 family protein [Candidatus Binatia bacterium]|jgi:predicted secreted protein|nr:protease inhibitor I42 family protein [Candidatus Binatia bacterium]
MKRMAFRALLALVLLATVASGADDDVTERRDLRAGDRFEVTLEANPTTGYAWSLAPDPNAAVVRSLGSSFERPMGAAVGAGGQDVWTFQAVGPGTAIVTLVYGRPWERGVEPARTHTIDVHVGEDAFAYCKTAGDVDAPPGPTPDAVAAALSRRLAVPPIPADRVSWRCMDGAVWACTVGANIQCDAKLDTDRTPTDGMRTWCRENPTADVVPAYVTGRATAFEWRCTDGAPTIVREFATPDARGFDPTVWSAVSPP